MIRFFFARRRALLAGLILAVDDVVSLADMLAEETKRRREMETAMRAVVADLRAADSAVAPLPSLPHLLSILPQEPSA